MSGSTKSQYFGDKWCDWAQAGIDKIVFLRKGLTDDAV